MKLLKLKGYYEEFEIQEAKIKKGIDLGIRKYKSSELQYLNNKFLNTVKKPNFKKKCFNLLIPPYQCMIELLVHLGCSK